MNPYNAPYTWKWAESDTDLEHVMSDGVAEIGMPPNKTILTQDQIHVLADFIRAKRK